MRTILGLDPGLARVGYGLIRVEGSRYRHLDHGVIRTRAQAGTGPRLLQIHDEVERLLREHRPESAGMETLFFARGTPNALQVAEARGVLLLCLIRNGVPVSEYTPSQVKLAVLGRGAGRAEKQQVQEMLKLLLGLKRAPRPYDAADALAIAVCHCNSSWTTVAARIPGPRRAQ
jgi:crossover junction endodeoxyribonuclease RuvC